MPLQRPVNDRQLEILRRIADGRQPVSSTEPELATTVYALRARGLVETKRRNGGWAAVPTEHGVFYAQHERYPTHPRNGQRPPRATPAPGAAPSPARPPLLNRSPGEPPRRARTPPPRRTRSRCPGNYAPRIR